MYLKIETAADITPMGKSSTICNQIWNGNNDRRSTKCWPNIHDYPRKWLETWKALLKDYILPKLQSRPLGSWRTKSHQIWPWTTNDDRNVLQYGESFYKRDELGQYVVTDEVHTCTIYCEVRKKKNAVYLITVMQLVQYEDSDQATTWIERNWGTLQYTSQMEEDLYAQIINDNVIAASDGSQLHGKMAHAFCFARKDTCKIICSGAAPVDYPTTDATSYRAEACGTLAIVTILEKLSKRKNVENCNVSIFIDNTETIKTMTDKIFYSMSSILRDN